ncbi:MAG TPA: sigma-54-dependent Fis family transcriptional regulator [Peptococcaceae bacterium]|nr:sigma-54-dependent Fis family transcriptional regulator [Peptococcaceae bacterium]
MKKELLKKFPGFLRLTPENNIEFSWGIDANLQMQIRESLINGQLDENKKLKIDEGTLELYKVAGSLKSLVIFNQAAEGSAGDNLFPIKKLANYAASPQTVINSIAEWVMQAVQFERFDLVRVNRPLRRFNFEYSLGVDIEGVFHTAYKEVSDSGLAWLLNNEKPYLVENFTPEAIKFSEDQALYKSGFRSTLRVPLIFNHGVIGAILLADSKPGHFQLEDALLLEILAQKVAQPFFHAGILQEQEYNTLASSTLLQTIAEMKDFTGTTEFLNLYCQTLKQLAKTDRVGLFLINQEKGEYCCLAEAGKKLAVLGEWLPIGKLPFREMLNLKSIIAFNLADPRYGTWHGLMGRGLTAMLYAPITDARGEIKACLVAGTADESAMTKHIAGLFKVASEQLGVILNRSILSLEDKKEPVRPKEGKPPGFEDIIGSSPAIMETIQKAAAVAEYEFPILITGETGTGKELFAKAIHRASSVAKGPFIVVNSAAIPDNLLESELFGYKEGAFTGGVKGGKKGKILLAHGGTLFLDEIGELSLDLQAKLLRVIQEKEVEPLGAEKPIPVDVRIISATHRNLQEMVKNQEFRDDLYYRLNSIEIKIPPLRERGEDIIELAENMLAEVSRRSGKRPKRLSAAAKEALLKFDWPGNVRQLQNLINWAFVFAEDDVIKVEDLPPEIQPKSRGNHEEAERQELARLLKEFNGNKTALANHLGITRTGLWKKLKRLGLQ